MQLLKQSTAATIVVGPVLDASGAAVTTAVAANFSIAKNGTVAALTTETVTHSVNGHYTIALTTGNTNTLGQLDVIVNASTMAMANHRYTILTAGMFDAIVTNGRLIYSDTANSEVHVTGAKHIAADVHQMQDDVITAAAIADNAITAAALASDAVTEIQSGLATTTGMTAAFTEIKGAGWSSSTDTLKDIAASSGGGSGTGARTVTVTVNDGTTALQNATVRMSSGSETYTATTNASGVCTFNLDDATWTVAITRSGYSFAGTTLVVDGTEAVTYSMTEISLTPSTGSFVTGYWTCYSEAGAVESGVTITMQALKVPTDKGYALDSATRTAMSAANGVAQFTNLVPGATYKVRRGTGDYYVIKIADDATGTVELNSIIGT